MRNLSKLNPNFISVHGSQDYIKSVIEDLLAIIKEQDRLAQEVLTFNPDCLEIGAGKMNNLRELAKEIAWM